MDKLPDELMDRICWFLASAELWKVVQVSSRFRRLAMLPYLWHFDISQENIDAGTLTLSSSKSFHLILVVARMSPVKRLICFKDVLAGSRLSFKTYQRLAAVLSVADPIPDIVIYNKQYLLQRTRREAAYLLSHIPSSANSTLLLVRSSAMGVSHPRTAPPIQWKLLPPPFGAYNLPTTMKVLIVIFGIPLLFAYLVSALVNSVVLMRWVWRRLSQPPWSQEKRILEDFGALAFDDWMRIQTLPIPGKQQQLTLVTLTDSRWPVLVLKPLSGLGDKAAEAAAYSALLAAVDLGLHLERLTVEKNTNLVLSELLAFLARHPHLTSIQLEANAVHAIADNDPPPAPALPDAENKVSMLTLPACYLPYLLPAAPNVRHVSLLFSSLTYRLRPKFQATFDLPSYRTALKAMATLPGTHPLTLSLAFRPTAAALPWLLLPPFSPALDPTLFPETLLPRVNLLWLYTDPTAHQQFRAADIRRMVPWLALFPGLQKLSFAYGTVESHIGVEVRVELAEAICRDCKGIGTPQDVAFNISQGLGVLG
ncbi:hypothetical protein R3P38DRAFT_3385740 [Favolaschia claudopus]|uniref:F-box domain-containing protein n=1 Tax=Favolaschia claudopus TaxID=2862362 RepID=A0AAW0DU87_9AGAR